MPGLMQTPGVHHIGLRCGDLGKAKRFYVDLLGFQPIREAPILIFQADASLNGRLYVAFKDPDRIARESYLVR